MNNENGKISRQIRNVLYNGGLSLIACIIIGHETSSQFIILSFIDIIILPCDNPHYGCVILNN